MATKNQKKKAFDPDKAFKSIIGMGEDDTTTEENDVAEETPMAAAAEEQLSDAEPKAVDAAVKETDDAVPVAETAPVQEISKPEEAPVKEQEPVTERNTEQPVGEKKGFAALIDANLKKPNAIRKVRVGLVVTEDTAAKLDMAVAKGLTKSKNDLINVLLEQYFNEIGDLLN